MAWNFEKYEKCVKNAIYDIIIVRVMKISNQAWNKSQIIVWIM